MTSAPGRATFCLVIAAVLVADACGQPAERGVAEDLPVTAIVASEPTRPVDEAAAVDTDRDLPHVSDVAAAMARDELAAPELDEWLGPALTAATSASMGECAAAASWPVLDGNAALALVSLSDAFLAETLLNLDAAAGALAAACELGDSTGQAEERASVGLILAVVEQRLGELGAT